MNLRGKQLNYLIMAKKQSNELPPKVTCEGCSFCREIAMQGHSFCEHPHIRMIQITKYLKPCIFKQQK